MLCTQARRIHVILMDQEKLLLAPAVTGRTAVFFNRPLSSNPQQHSRNARHPKTLPLCVLLSGPCSRTDQPYVLSKFDTHQHFNVYRSGHLVYLASTALQTPCVSNSTPTTNPSLSCSFTFLLLPIDLANATSIKLR